MNHVYLLKRCFWAILAVTLIIYWCPNQSRAASKPITPEELKYSGPFEITARIMEIHPGKAMLIVAEYAVYVVDVTVGAEHLSTVLSDAEGGPVAFESLDRGQTVLVRGLQLPDGRVIAELIRITTEESSERQTDHRRRPAVRTVREIKPIN